MSHNPLWEQFERPGCFAEQKCNCEPFQDGLIMQPLSVISSIPYIIIGTVFFFRLRKDDNFKLTILAFTLILTGIASMITHSVFLQITELFDFGCVFFIMSWIFLEVSNPLLTKKKFFLYWPALGIFPIVALAIAKGKGIQIFAILFPPLLYKIIQFHRQHKHREHLQVLMKKIVFFMGISIVCNLSDNFRFFCFDDLYLHGHTLWHLFTTITMIYLFKYFEFISKERKTSHE